MADRASKQLAPFDRGAFAMLVREPLALGSASRAVLRRPMRVGLCGYHPKRIRFLPCALIDLAPELVGLFAVHAARFAAPFGPDLAEPLKDQYTARIPGADVGDAAGHPVSGVVVHPANMPPQVLITVLVLHRLA